jgi:outer membrane protein OmpA-like peptidoglycan-associated protein
MYESKTLDKPVIAQLVVSGVQPYWLGNEKAQEKPFEFIHKEKVYHVTFVKKYIIVVIPQEINKKKAKDLKIEINEEGKYIYYPLEVYQGIQPKYDRWGILELQNKELKDVYFIKLEKSDSQFADFKSKLPFTTVDIVNSYLEKNEGKYPPNITKPDPLPEYFVFNTTKEIKSIQVLNGKEESISQELPITYMYWNGKGLRNNGGLPPSIKIGHYRYYDIERKYLTDDFYKSFSGGQFVDFTTKAIDEVISKASISTEAPKLKIREQKNLDENSYEKYKWEEDKLPVIQNGIEVNIPIKEAIGQLTPKNYIEAKSPDSKSETSDSKSITYKLNINRKNTSFYGYIPPMFPPTSMKPSFKTGKSKVMGDVIDTEIYKIENFIKDMNDVVMYMRYYPNVNIEIIGHTSKAGGDVVNIPLSGERAKSTKDYIEKILVGEDNNKFTLEGKNRVISKGVGAKGLDHKDSNDNNPEDRYIEIIYSVDHSNKE